MRRKDVWCLPRHPTTEVRKTRQPGGNIFFTPTCFIEQYLCSSQSRKVIEFDGSHWGLEKRWQGYVEASARDCRVTGQDGLTATRVTVTGAPGTSAQDRHTGVPDVNRRTSGGPDRRVDHTVETSFPL